jgi:hypothetical protein
LCRFKQQRCVINCNQFRPGFKLCTFLLGYPLPHKKMLPEGIVNGVERLGAGQSIVVSCRSMVSLSTKGLRVSNCLVRVCLTEGEIRGDSRIL